MKITMVNSGLKELRNTPDWIRKNVAKQLEKSQKGKHGLREISLFWKQSQDIELNIFRPYYIFEVYCDTEYHGRQCYQSQKLSPSFHRLYWNSGSEIWLSHFFTWLNVDKHPTSYATLTQCRYNTLTTGWRSGTLDQLLTLSSLSLPLSSSSTTSRELLSQFPTCSGWRWFDVAEKVKKISMHW